LASLTQESGIGSGWENEVEVCIFIVRSFSFRMSRVLVQALWIVGVAAALIDTPAWKSVAIGGGGYVLQTFFSSVDSYAYMKTDVGGIYRRCDALLFTWGSA
jgi:hypothetical protein